RRRKSSRGRARGAKRNAAWAFLTESGLRGRVRRRTLHVEREALVAARELDLDGRVVDAREGERDRPILRRREDVLARLRHRIFPAHLHALDREVPLARL